MGKHFDEALRLLAANDIGGAEALLSSIGDEIEQLEEDHELIEEMIERKRGPAPKVRPSKAQTELPLQPARKINIKKRIPGGMDRSSFIRVQASEMAKMHGGRVTVDQMVEALSPYALNTPVPGTVIANVLFKAKGWKRLDRGVYEWVGTA